MSWKHLPFASIFVLRWFIWEMGPEYHSCFDRPSDDGFGKASAERFTTGTKNRVREVNHKNEMYTIKINYAENQ